MFIKIFLVMVLSIILVSVLITFSTIRMSENLFMDTFSITNNKSLDHIQNNFESYSYAVVTTANSAQNNGAIKDALTHEATSTIEEARASYEIREQMDWIFSNVEAYDAGMVITGRNEGLFNMDYITWPVGLEELQDHPITEQTLNHPRQLMYHFVPADELHDEPMIIASKALIERSTDLIYGIVYIPIPETDWRQFYGNYTSEGSDLFILDGNGEIISSNQEAQIGEEIPELLEFSEEVEAQSLEHKEIHLFGKDYLLLSQYLPTFNMYLVNLVDKELIMNNLINTREIVLISTAIVLLAVLVVYIISRRMTRSLTRLVNQISNMAKYDFHKPLTVEKSYEAKEIANAFNYMLNELQEYVGIIVQTQKRQRKAELEALQQQINPHFLYNTLTSVKFLVQKEEKEKATEVIHSLIGLLQSALGNVNETITVEEELRNMKDYVWINQTRYGDNIKVNYFVSPDCVHYYLPKLIVQPFIENAFFHAFTEKKSGYIQILIAKRDGNLVCEVMDNGDGMDLAGIHPSAKKESRQRQLFSGIGVRNVHERIQLLYGDSYGVEVSSKIGEGTKVKIILPLLKEKEENPSFSILSSKEG